jgi:hypothetical protein
MTLPFPLPDWLPWWAVLIIVVLALLYLLLFLVMPFSVFGLKGRLDAIEARLEQMQYDMRAAADRRPPSPDMAAAEEPTRPPPRRAPSGRIEPRLDWPRE